MTTMIEKMDAMAEMHPEFITISRSERSRFNQEMRGKRGFKPLICPNLGAFDQVAGEYKGIPIYVLDDEPDA